MQGMLQGMLHIYNTLADSPYVRLDACSRIQGPQQVAAIEVPHEQQGVVHQTLLQALPKHLQLDGITARVCNTGN